MLSDFGFQTEVKLFTDATAAIGMVRRLGLGKVRHLATADLWIQAMVRQGKVAVAKVPGQENGADLMTKHKGRPEIIKHLQGLGFGFLSGRPGAAPRRTNGWEMGKVIPVPHSTASPTITTIDAIADYDSNIAMHYPVFTCILEGRQLYPSRSLPPRSRRLLYSLYDLNKESGYSIATAEVLMILTCIPW